MKFILKHPKLVIALSVLITVIFAIPLRNIKIESSIRQFFPQKHEAYKRLNATEDQFGSMIAIGISLETPGETILTPDYVSIIQKITEDLEQVPDTSSVTSLTNIDFIEGDDGAINVAPLFEDEDDTVSEADIDFIKERLSAWEDMYNLVVVSEDYHATQISLSVNPKATLAQQDVALKSVRRIVNEDLAMAGSDLMVKFYGDPVISEESKSFMISDLAGLIPLVALVVLLSLYFSFNTLDGTLLPLITVLMSTVWSVGLMVALGFEFSIVSSVIPVALIGCGSAYGIHVLTHYYIAVDEKFIELKKSGQKFTKEIHKECIAKGLKNVATAVVLSAITTVVGFISLVTSPLRPLFGFAIFTAVGIAYSLLLSVTVIPAFLVLKKEENIGKRSKYMEKVAARAKKRLEKIESSRFKKVINHESSAPGLSDTLYKIYHFFCGTKPRMIEFCTAIIVISLIGLTKVIIDTSMVNYFPETARLRQDINYVNDNFAGTNSVYLLIKSPAAKYKDQAKDLYAEIDKIEAAYKDKTMSEAVTAKLDKLRSDAEELMAKSGESLNMTNPDALKAVDNMEHWITTKYDTVGKAISYSDSIKRINQSWNTPEASLADSNSSAEVGFEEDLGFFGFDDFDFGFGMEEEEEAEEESLEELENPNVAYSQMLSQQMTAKDVQDYMNAAYSKAGGRRANLEDFIRTFQKQMNYNGIAYYEIPYEPAKYQKRTKEELSGIISDYTLMLGDSMERFTDDPVNFKPTTIRMQVQIKSNSTQVVGKMLTDIEEYAAKHLPEGYYMEATGEGEMEYVMTNLVVSSQISSLIMSLALVFILITISFKSPVAGLIGAVPLALTIILNYMVMGFAGIKLDLFTSIIASVAIGVGIDYTIHFMTEFKALRQNSDDLEYVTRETFRSSGAGIITNALGVGFGFLVLCLSKFVVLRYIGILVAIVMFTSSMLAMTILPAIFNHFDPQFLHKGKPKAWEAATENKTE